MSERLSYWLMPAEPDKTRFSEIIAELARRFDAPAFEPHVTLYSGPRDPRDRAEEIVRAAASGISAMSLQAAGLVGSEEFTKTLFVEFRATEAVLALSGELKRQSAQPIDYQLRPHLSLIYAPLVPEVKQRLAKEIVTPTLVRFDTVKAILSRERTQTGEDVKAWRQVAVQSLVVH